jgi:hypothetical protein
LVLFKSPMTTESTVKSECAQKKTNCGDFPMFFIIPRLTACSSNPSARELISVAIPFDHLKKRSTDAKGKCWSWLAKMDNNVRSESYPAFVVSGSCIEVELSAVWDQC